MRLCGGICILDPEKNFEPAAFLQFNKDSQDQYKVEQVDKDTWKVVFDKIHSPGHEIGFSPDGKRIVLLCKAERTASGRYDLSVAPTALPADHPLARMSEWEMGVVYHTDISGRASATSAEETAITSSQKLR